MAAIEWVSIWVAIAQLESRWGIPQTIAEGILWNVLQGGEVEVRGRAQYQLVPQIVTKKICSSLIPNSFVSSEWEDIEVDWNGLLVHGRKLVPRWIQISEPPTMRKGASHKRARAERAIKELWPSGPPDAQNVPNKELCKAVADKIEADAREAKFPRVDISDDTILRAAGRLH